MMSTTLCLDFGNTRLKWAVFSGGEIQHTGVFRDDGLEDLMKCLETYHPDRSILSSVIDQNRGIEEL
jgi:type III pantothenate kinase